MNSSYGRKSDRTGGKPEVCHIRCPAADKLYACRVPLDVVIPDLLLPSQAAAALREVRLPHLERWLARADVQRLDMQGATPWLGQRFGLAEPFPVAAVTLAADDAPRERLWLRADPVHLQISSEAVALHD